MKTAALGLAVVRHFGPPSKRLFQHWKKARVLLTKTLWHKEDGQCLFSLLSLTECCLTLLLRDVANSLMSFVSLRVILAIPFSIKVTGGLRGGEESSSGNRS